LGRRAGISGYSQAVVFGAGAYNLVAAGDGETVIRCVSKVNDYFSIHHPDPSKKGLYYLQHKTIESPSAGENLYRYQVTTINCHATIELPSYYKYLNTDDYVFVSPSDNLGNAHGIMNQEQTCVDIYSNQDGKFDVLIIGTRKDKSALNSWSGAERLTRRTKYVNIC